MERVEGIIFSNREILIINLLWKINVKSEYLMIMTVFIYLIKTLRGMSNAL